LLFDRLRLVLAPLDRFDELLLLTDPLLRLLELDRLRLTVPLLLLLPERLRLTVPLLLLFDLLRFTVPDDRFVFVLDRLTVDRLFDLLVPLERIELDERVRSIALLLLVT
jgi:hypothetical protein